MEENVYYDATLYWPEMLATFTKQFFHYNVIYKLLCNHQIIVKVQN